MLTVNAEDLHESFHRAMQEHPYDPHTHMIYGDYLEENGHNKEALDHRIIGHALGQGSQAARRHADWVASGGDPDLDPFFRQYIREQPHQAYRRLLYSGWLGQNNRPKYARFQHILGHALARGSEGARLFSEAWGARGIVDPIPATRTVRGKERPLTLPEVSLAAVKSGHGLMGNFQSQRDARNAEDNIAGYAHNIYKKFKSAKPDEGSIHLANAHDIAALHAMRAAHDIATRGRGRYTRDKEAAYHRAAFAHLTASHLHRENLPTETTP